MSKCPIVQFFVVFHRCDLLKISCSRRHLPHILIPCSSLYFLLESFLFSFLFLFWLLKKQNCFLKSASPASLCCLPSPTPSYSPPFPRVASRAPSFLCAQLSVRGYTTPHAFLGRRPVNRLTCWNPNGWSSSEQEKVLYDVDEDNWRAFS